MDSEQWRSRALACIAGGAAAALIAHLVFRAMVHTSVNIGLGVALFLLAYNAMILQRHNKRRRLGKTDDDPPADGIS